MDINSQDTHNFNISDKFQDIALFGSVIGYGVERIVFEYKPDPKHFVVKVCIGDTDAINTQEYINYRHLRWNFLKWVAPCDLLEHEGRQLLIMARTYPTEPCNYPSHIPSLFLDIKKHNWGILKCNVVCHDYHKLKKRTSWQNGGFRYVDWQTMPR
jgi:hypothetical protein